MPTLSALYKYPVKSCRGTHCLVDLEIDADGPRDDRLFAVTSRDGTVRTQRREQGGFTKLALVQPIIHDDPPHLLLSAPGMPSLSTIIIDASFPHEPTPITIFDAARLTIDQGDEPAAWFSDYLHVHCRLVRQAEYGLHRVDPVFALEPAFTRLTDGFPLLLISDASLGDLNMRLLARGCPPVCRENFRAALWVDGCKPYEEDTWEIFSINDVVYSAVKPCARCSITQVDVATGEYRTDNEPLITLRQYRYQTIPQTGKGGVMFGQNLVHRGTGTVHVGDQITIIKRRS